jgi:ribosomal 50S subunit-recycling heat shock protein
VSRSAARRMIEDGLVRVDDNASSPAHKVRAGERVKAWLVEEGLKPRTLLFRWCSRTSTFW